MAQLGNSVSAANLATMLNVEKKASAICKASSINQWSKIKPINYSKTGPLDRAKNEFRGMSTDQAKGIYYGLKAGVQNLTAANIHAADWSYVGRPTGTLSSPYRFSDFWGYEKDEKYPTLSGSGLYNGQEAIYSNNTNITTTLTSSNLTSIVDVAEAIGNSMDYTKLYLCVLVGNKARAMLNKDTGTVTPIVYNNVEYKTFCFPDMSGIINTSALPMTSQVSIFLVGSDGIATFRDSWVDLTTAINIGTKPVTLPKQVNLSIKFTAPGLVYITAFNIEAIVGNRGQQEIYATFTNGKDWSLANSYRILYNITAASGGTGTADVLIEKTDAFTGANITSDTIPLSALMMTAGFVQNVTPATYTIRGSFQVKESSGANWKETGYTKTITVSW